MSTEELIQQGLEQSKRGGDPERARTLALLALASAIENLSGRTQLTIDPPPLPRRERATGPGKRV